jgi:hypothetical protein
MNTDRIRDLNDSFRTKLVGGRVLMTCGIVGRADANDIVRRVQAFDAFDEANDPHHEHDFGAFEAGRDSIFWKIDYYAPDLMAGSTDPSDPALTTRVLTVMLASEY